MKLHNVINLKNDKVFIHSIEYDDTKDYTDRMIKQYEPTINADEREIQDRVCPGGDLRPCDSRET